MKWFRFESNYRGYIFPVLKSDVSEGDSVKWLIVGIKCELLHYPKNFGSSGIRFFYVFDNSLIDSHV